MPTRFAFAMIGSVLVLAALTQAATVVYVGVESVGADWRTTSVVKALDVDNDNVIGTAGYFVAAAQVSPGSGFDNVSALLETETNGARALISLPLGVGLNSLRDGDLDNSDHIAHGFGYTAIDDPREVPGASVADLEIGLVVPNFVETINLADVLEITFGPAAAGQAFRIGVMTLGVETGDGVDRVALGGVDSGAELTTGTGFNDIHFFDVTNIMDGDVLTLALSGDLIGDGNGQPIYRGLTFDVVPEPTSLSLLALAGLTLIRRRRA